MPVGNTFILFPLFATLPTQKKKKSVYIPNRSWRRSIDENPSVIVYRHTGHCCVQYSQQGGASLCITAACDSWAAEGNKSQGKLASSGCTLIRSILLSLCALFSPSPNSETLNLLTQIHGGPEKRIDAETRVFSRDTTHARRMEAGCGGYLQVLFSISFFFLSHIYTHTHKCPPQGIGSPT